MTMIRNRISFFIVNNIFAPHFDAKPLDKRQRKSPNFSNSSRPFSKIWWQWEEKANHRIKNSSLRYRTHFSATVCWARLAGTATRSPNSIAKNKKKTIIKNFISSFVNSITMLALARYSENVCSRELVFNWCFILSLERAMSQRMQKEGNLDAGSRTRVHETPESTNPACMPCLYVIRLLFHFTLR